VNKILAVIVAVTCLVVVSAVGLWALDRQEAKTEQAAADHRASEGASAASYEKCRSVVGAWDAGDKAPAIRLWGAASAATVESCRWLIELYEVDH